MARLWCLFLQDGWRLEPEGENETLETKVVSNRGGEGVSGNFDGEGRHERETDKAVTLVPCG